MSNPPNILFEDESLVVLAKPAGLVVNRADSVKEATLQDWFEDSYPSIFDSLLAKSIRAEAEQLFIDRGGMVHRLDKDTSGVMVWAKTPATMIDLMAEFKHRQVDKTYWALVHGKFSVPTGQIRVPLSRTTRDRKKFGVVVGGKMTETRYQVLKKYKGEGNLYQAGFSLVELYPKTGRTHQLRVVLKHLHHPIVGDVTYVGRKRAKADREWCPRQFLHAHELSFSHPESHKYVSFRAPLSEDLETVLTGLSEVEV